MFAEQVLDALERAAISYALIGGHALAARGYARFTADIDFLTADPRALDSDTWVAPRSSGTIVENSERDS